MVETLCSHRQETQQFSCPDSTWFLRNWEDQYLSPWIPLMAYVLKRSGLESALIPEVSPPLLPMWSHSTTSVISLHWLQILKTKDLSPEHNYLMGVHPHGLLTFGAFCNFCTEATGFSKIFPGITPHLATLSWFFKIPLIRDYLMAKGASDHTRSSNPFLLLEMHLFKPPISCLSNPLTLPPVIIA